MDLTMAAWGCCCYSRPKWPGVNPVLRSFELAQTRGSRDGRASLDGDGQIEDAVAQSQRRRSCWKCGSILVAWWLGSVTDRDGE